MTQTGDIGTKLNTEASVNMTQTGDIGTKLNTEASMNMTQTVDIGTKLNTELCTRPKQETLVKKCHMLIIRKPCSKFSCFLILHICVGYLFYSDGVVILILKVAYLYITQWHYLVQYSDSDTLWTYVVQ